MKWQRLGREDSLLIVGLRQSGKTTFANGTILPLHPTAAVWTPHPHTFDVGFFPDVARVPSAAKHWGVSIPFLDRKVIIDSFGRFAQEAMRRRVAVVIVDEIVLLEEFNCLFPLINLVTQSGNYGIPVVSIVQRAYSVNLTVRSQTSRVVSFQQTDEHDVRALVRMAAKQDEWGLCEKKSDDKCNARGVTCLKHLKCGQYVTAACRSA